MVKLAFCFLHRSGTLRKVLRELCVKKSSEAKKLKDAEGLLIWEYLFLLLYTHNAPDKVSICDMLLQTSNLPPFIPSEIGETRSAVATVSSEGAQAPPATTDTKPTEPKGDPKTTWNKIREYCATGDVDVSLATNMRSSARVCTL